MFMYTYMNCNWDHSITQFHERLLALRKRQGPFSCVVTSSSTWALMPGPLLWGVLSLSVSRFWGGLSGSLDIFLRVARRPGLLQAWGPHRVTCKGERKKGEHKTFKCLIREESISRLPWENGIRHFWLFSQEMVTTSRGKRRCITVG